MWRVALRRFSTYQKPRANSTEQSISQDDILSPMSSSKSYQFPTVTALSSNYSPAREDTSDISRTDGANLPDGMDPVDIRNIMTRLQRVDIERGLSEATNPQERFDIVRKAANDMARRERMYKQRDKQRMQSTRSRMAGVYLSMQEKHQFNLPEIAQMLTLSTGGPTKSKTCLYEVSTIESFPYEYMIFVTAENSTHMYSIADTVYKLLSKRSIVASTTSTLSLTGGLSDPWVLLDLGSIGIHISFGSMRDQVGMELCLEDHYLSPSEWTSLPNVNIKECRVILRNPASNITKTTINSPQKNFKIQSKQIQQTK